jgi:hypothetical protein
VCAIDRTYRPRFPLGYKEQRWLEGQLRLSWDGYPNISSTDGEDTAGSVFVAFVHRSDSALIALISLRLNVL